MNEREVWRACCQKEAEAQLAAGALHRMVLSCGHTWVWVAIYQDRYLWKLEK